ncbi:hypothetical protein GCM10020295_29410 [Streptomyces cinereospinus]
MLGTAVEGADHHPEAVGAQGVGGPQHDPRAALLGPAQRPGGRLALSPGCSGGDQRPVGQRLGAAEQLAGHVQHAGLHVHLDEAAPLAVVKSCQQPVTACRGTVPPPPPVGAVAPVTAADLADAPAALVAVTWKAYDVDAASPVTVADVPVTAVPLVPSR